MGDVCGPLMEVAVLAVEWTAAVAACLMFCEVYLRNVVWWASVC